MLHLLSHFFTQKVRSDYNSIAESFSGTRETAWPGWELIKKYFSKDRTVLDIGCGNGRLSQAFLFKSYLGVDISEELIKIAKEKYEDKSKGISFQNGSFLSLPSSIKPTSSTDSSSNSSTLPIDSSTSKFNIIVSIAAFHPLPSPNDRKKTLENIHSSLKKDGIFIFSVWNLLHMEKYIPEKKKALLRSILTLGMIHHRDLLIPWRKGLNKRNRYYYVFKLEEVEKLLKNADFELIETIFEKNGKKVAIKEAHNIYFICRKK